MADLRPCVNIQKRAGRLRIIITGIIETAAAYLNAYFTAAVVTSRFIGMNPPAF